MGKAFTDDFSAWLMPKVRVEDRGHTSACWTWRWALTEKGYARTRLPQIFGGKRLRIHRAAYEFLIGPFPDGLVADHLCRNRNCVNPAHVEPVTIGENTRRGEGANQYTNRTHCSRGHAYTPENTYHRRTGRTCRACRNAYVQERQRLAKARAGPA